MIYIPANNNMCSSNMGAKVEYKAGKGFVGITGSHPFMVPVADHFGEVQAWNVDTGEKVWTHKYAKSPNWGSMLATAGGLVFSGGTSDRRFHAFDAMTGEVLWEFPTNSGGSARQAICRHRVGLGRRFTRRSEQSQSSLPGRVS